MRRAIGAAFFLFLKASVIHADEIPVAEGCIPLMTVHKEQRVASTIFDCAGNRIVVDFEQGDLRQDVLCDSGWSMIERAWKRRAFGAEVEYYPQHVRFVPGPGQPRFLSRRSDFGSE